MKVNVPITIGDVDRSKLADVLDRKSTKRLVSRREVVELCQRHISGLAHSETPKAVGEPEAPPPGSMYIADPEDVPLMAQPNNPSYVYGWNKVKRGQKI